MYINRPAHILSAEKTLTIPRNYIFFDTETTPYENLDKSIRQCFKLGWCCYYRRTYGRHKEKTDWLYFDNVSTFWAFVFDHTNKKERLWIIARNIVFDFTVCRGWEYLRNEGYTLDFYCNNGVTAIVTVSNKRSSIVFNDSLNWFVESIEQTGERLGLPKLKIDFNRCTDAELSAYCHRDVEIDLENFKLFIKFLLDNDISRLCYTRASTAMSAYLYKHCKKLIYIHNNNEAIRMERASYKGGRCECFYIGELNSEMYYIVDVNSLYPYVMKNNTYPVKYLKTLYSPILDDYKAVKNDYAVVAKVYLDTDEPVYGIKQDRLIFPVGCFSTTLCTPELNYALEHNHLKHINTLILYDKANIFTSYVDTFYQLRRKFKQEGIKEYEEICKKLLNSLYGKFGQKGENWVKIGEAMDEPDREEIVFRQNPHTVTRIRYLLGEVFELKGWSESFNSFPAIASHVTAYGRMYLWSLIKKAGIENCYYCDTDSLILNENGLLNLAYYMNETELGSLKLVEKTNHLVIRGLKDYDTDDKQITKGIRKNAVLISPDTYEQQRWPSFRSTLKSGDANVYTITKVIKHLSRDYTKGTVTDSGRIEPYLIYEPI